MLPILREHFVVDWKMCECFNAAIHDASHIHGFFHNLDFCCVCKKPNKQKNPDFKLNIAPCLMICARTECSCCVEMLFKVFIRRNKKA